MLFLASIFSTVAYVQLITGQRHCMQYVASRSQETAPCSGHLSREKSVVFRTNVADLPCFTPFYFISPTIVYARNNPTTDSHFLGTRNISLAVLSRIRHFKMDLFRTAVTHSLRNILEYRSSNTQAYRRGYLTVFWPFSRPGIYFDLAFICRYVRYSLWVYNIGSKQRCVLEASFLCLYSIT